MNWKKVDFGEVVDLKQGMAFNKKNNHLVGNEGLPILRIVDLNDNTETKFIKNELVPKQFISSKSDIIYSRTGVHLGLVYSNRVGIVHNNCFIIIPKTEEINKRFLFWYLKQPSIINEARSKAGGSAQPDLNHNAFKSISFCYPKIQTQKRIADILSAYDDLIENNLKHIKLLEQAAQNIYKEWFVNMRFPGYENTPINKETGDALSKSKRLPEGWEEKNINDVFNIKYGKNLPVNKIKKQGYFPVYGASGVMGFFNEFNTDNKVALITSRGNGSGDIHRTKQEKTFVTNNSFKVYPKNNYEYIPFFFVTEFLKSLHLRNYCSGSAQPQLTNSAMKNISAIFPNKEIIVLFNYKVESIIKQVDLLLEKNEKLKSARDILLPRLMNQTIEV